MTYRGTATSGSHRSCISDVIGHQWFTDTFGCWQPTRNSLIIYISINYCIGFTPSIRGPVDAKGHRFLHPLRLHRTGEHSIIKVKKFVLKSRLQYRINITNRVPGILPNSEIGSGMLPNQGEDMTVTNPRQVAVLNGYLPSKSSTGKKSAICYFWKWNDRICLVVQDSQSQVMY